MKITRILNNNAVIIFDSNDTECVVLGKGIAFKKKIGDNVDPNAINKVFTLKDKSLSEQYQKIVANIPLEHLEVSAEIIEIIKTELGNRINDTLYITLSDHIHTAILRFLDGVTIVSPMKWDIKHFYNTEYQLGLKSLKIINNRFKIDLPEDEASFIALHIINSQMDNNSIQQVVEITKIVQEILNIVKYYFSIDFDTESIQYYRFITHLKLFAQRLVNNNSWRDEQIDDLITIIKDKYQTSYKCVQRISKFISRKYEYILSNEEMLYLTIHIQRVIYKEK